MCSSKSFSKQPRPRSVQYCVGPCTLKFLSYIFSVARSRSLRTYSVLKEQGWTRSPFPPLSPALVPQIARMTSIARTYNNRALVGMSRVCNQGFYCIQSLCCSTWLCVPSSISLHNNKGAVCTIPAINRKHHFHCFAGNWYEDRLATPRTQVSEVQNEDAGKTLRQDKLVRDSEPNTFRTQTVDFSKTPSEPYTPADTMRTAKTTKAEMESRVSEVCC